MQKLPVPDEYIESPVYKPTQAFHITQNHSLFGDEGILEKGLIPQIGERGQKKKELKPRVYLINDTGTCTEQNWIELWKRLLFECSWEELSLLCVNLDGMDCFRKRDLTAFLGDEYDKPKPTILKFQDSGDEFIGEIYTKILVPPQRISVVEKVIDENGRIDIEETLVNI